MIRLLRRRPRKVAPDAYAVFVLAPSGVTLWIRPDVPTSAVVDAMCELSAGMAVNSHVVEQARR